MSPTFSLAQVRLRGIPVQIWLRATAHLDGLQREFAIMEGNLPRHSIPNRLTTLIEELRGRFGGFSDSTWDELRLAAERGDESTDLTFTVPVDAAAASRQLSHMLDEVDEYCRSGHELLTLATPPDIAKFRKWILDEFIGQIERGYEPTTWVEYSRSQYDYVARVSTTQPEAMSAPDTIIFEGDLDLATAGALREMIQERRASGVGELTVDLTRVGFMDSVGISLLVSTYNRFSEDGLSLRLILPPRLYSLLELAGLIDLLQPERADL
ncbi:MAG: STAS domain-containing protein [Acidimicrobiia bacterium]